MAIVAWDINILRTNFKIIAEQLKELSEQKTYLTNIRNDIASNWESPAGTAYRERMDEEISDLETLYDKLHRDMNNLSQAIENCYSECEEIISAKLSRLDGSI